MFLLPECRRPVPRTIVLPHLSLSSDLVTTDAATAATNGSLGRISCETCETINFFQDYQTNNDKTAETAQNSKFQWSWKLSKECSAQQSNSRDKNQVEKDIELE